MNDRQTEEPRVQTDAGAMIERPTMDIAVSPQVAAVLQEVRGAMMMAKEFPRDYMTCWDNLQKACQRESLAKKGDYSYKRGGSPIEGPSIYLARVAAQNWGNIRFGFDVLEVGEEQVSLVGWAWDMETNTKATSPATFNVLIQRKVSGTTKWVKPDERNLRELVNKHGAIAQRNAIFQILPHDYVDDARDRCRKTLKAKIKDAKSEQKRLVLGFSDYGVTPVVLNGYVGTDNWTKDDIVSMQGVLDALKDGKGKREDFFTPQTAEPKPRATGAADPDAKVGDPASHQSHAPTKTSQTPNTTPEFKELFGQDRDDLIMTLQIEMEDRFTNADGSDQAAIDKFWNDLNANNIASGYDEMRFNKKELANAILYLRHLAAQVESAGEAPKETPEEEAPAEDDGSVSEPEGGGKAIRIAELMKMGRGDLLTQAKDAISRGFDADADRAEFLRGLVSDGTIKSVDLTRLHKGFLSALIIAVTDHVMNANPTPEEKTEAPASQGDGNPNLGFE
jgi:hypothetical protein